MPKRQPTRLANIIKATLLFPIITAPWFAHANQCTTGGGIHYGHMDLAYGGIALSKTADLMLNVSELDGAMYDSGSGQVLFFGKKNVALPDMNFDDMAVAIRAIYQERENPGVSINTEPPSSSEAAQAGSKVALAAYGRNQKSSAGLVTVA